MHQLDPFLAYEPSLNTKAMWLYTRKVPTTGLAGLVLPGLFQTQRFPLDCSAFFGVILLEIWGLNWLLKIGDIGFSKVAALFLADLIFAVARHLFFGPICRLENRAVALGQLTPPDGRFLKRLRWGPRFFAVLISVVAGIKVISFLALQGGEPGTTTITILLTYCLAAVLHICCTGYFLFAVLTSALLKLDEKDFIDGPAMRFRPREHPFTAAVPLDTGRAGRHELVARSGGTPGEYVFVTTGLLHDDQLNALVQQQKSQPAKDAVARAGLKHQLEILVLAPNMEPVDDGQKVAP